MAFRSIYGYVSHTDQSAMHADRPVSAYSALILRNNMQHLVDAACQYRVNWCTSTSATEVGSSSDPDASPREYAWEFPLTITDENFFPNFDVRVGALVFGAGSPSAVVTVSLLATDGAHSSPIGTASATFTGITNTSAAYFDDLSADARFAIDDFAWQPYVRRVAYVENIGNGANLQVAPASFLPVRLVVSTVPFPGSSGYGAQLCAVHFREYL